jgi:hypothetical protein
MLGVSVGTKRSLLGDITFDDGRIRLDNGVLTAQTANVTNLSVGGVDVGNYMATSALNLNKVVSDIELLQYEFQPPDGRVPVIESVVGSIVGDSSSKGSLPNGVIITGAELFQTSQSYGPLQFVDSANDINVQINPGGLGTFKTVTTNRVNADTIILDGTNVQNQLSVIGDRLDGLDSSLFDVDITTDNHNGRLDNVEGRLDTAETAIASNITRLDDVDITTNNHNGRLDDVEDRLDTAETVIASNITRLDDVDITTNNHDGRLGNVEDEVDQQRLDIDKLAGNSVTAGAFDHSVVVEGTLVTRTRLNVGGVGSIKASIGADDGLITCEDIDVVDRVDCARLRIDGINIANLLVDIQQRIDPLELATTDHETRIDTAETSIASNITRLDDVDITTNNHDGRLGNVEDEVDQQRLDIDKLAGNSVTAGAFDHSVAVAGTLVTRTRLNVGGVGDIKASIGADDGLLTCENIEVVDRIDCARLRINGVNTANLLVDIQQRIDPLELDTADHETRIDNIETEISNIETVIGGVPYTYTSVHDRLTISEDKILLIEKYRGRPVFVSNWLPMRTDTAPAVPGFVIALDITIPPEIIPTEVLYARKMEVWFHPNPPNPGPPSTFNTAGWVVSPSLAPTFPPPDPTYVPAPTGYYVQVGRLDSTETKGIDLAVSGQNIRLYCGKNVICTERTSNYVHQIGFVQLLIY